MAESRLAGRIVDIVEPGKDRLELAWVREAAKGKARIRTAGGREHALSIGALEAALIADHGPAGADADGALARRAADVARVAVDAGDLDLLWESLAGDEDREETAASLAEALFGSAAPPAAASALARAAEADGDRLGRRSGRAVFVVFGRGARERRRRQAEQAAAREAADRERRAAADAECARATTLLRAFLDSRDPAAWPADLDPLLGALLDSCRLDAEMDRPDRDPEEAPLARAVVRRLEGDADPGTVRGVAERILRVRHPGESRTRRTRRLLGIGDPFPPAVEAEAERAAGAPDRDAVERLDLRDLETYTIDNPWTRDRDDALSVVERDGRLDVSVHVSDVATLVRRGSGIDAAARLRGVTHYWPDGTFPMLPALVERRASLDADAAGRPVLTARFACLGGPEPPAGAPPSLEPLGIHAATIRVAANLSYDEADEAMRTRAQPWAAPLLRLWEHLRAVRRARGGDAVASRREARILVEGDGERIDIVPVEGGTPARLLIEELALATGMAVAAWASGRGVPLIYRIQDAPSARSRGPERAGYTLTPDAHHSLGGALYAHVTSPIRRYVDLLNQRQVLSRLAAERPPGAAVEPDEQVDLQRINLGVRRVLDAARSLERNAHRYWALRWLAARPGDVFDAEVRADPDSVSGARPPRALVLPVVVLLPIAGLDRSVLAAAAADGKDHAIVRVRVEVGDAETLDGRAIVV